MSTDGLHPSVGGAFLYALAEYNVIKNWAFPNVYMPNSQSDVYNASNNPAGNLLGNLWPHAGDHRNGFRRLHDIERRGDFMAG